jgi:ATP-dependent DNA ligase
VSLWLLVRAPKIFEFIDDAIVSSTFIGVPLHPTLGSPTRSLDEVYERLNEQPFAAEFKYDGQRAQLHASRGDHIASTVKLFSRHLEDMTDKVCDLVGSNIVALQTDI